MTLVLIETVQYSVCCSGREGNRSSVGGSDSLDVSTSLVFLFLDDDPVTPDDFGALDLTEEPDALFPEPSGVNELSGACALARVTLEDG